MAKKKLQLTDSSGNEMTAGAPKVTGAKPVGMQILVELLSPQEVMATSLYVDDGAKIGAPQAYVLEVGPKLDPEWGVEAGQRVVLSGKFTPLPEIENPTGRSVATVDLQAIKAVLFE